MDKFLTFTALAFQILLPYRPINAQQLSFSKHLCRDGNQTTFVYEYNSKIVGFANATKYIMFTGKFELTCLAYDQKTDRFHFLINFVNLATKMKSNTTETKNKRLRKIPIRSSITTASTTTSRIVGSRPPDENGDKWFPLSLNPSRFLQASNGTVTDVFIHRADYDRQSEDRSIKKGITFMLQTLRNFSSPTDVMETFDEDDLGQHFSQYSLENLTSHFVVSKWVHPHDFVKLQYDSVNFNQIGLYLGQKQSISGDDGHLLSAEGKISTQSLNQNSDLPFGVVVTYSLRLIGQSNGQLSTSKRRQLLSDFVRYTRDNFTNQHFDNDENLLKIFNKKLENFGNVTVESIYNDIWNIPDTMTYKVTKIKSLLTLESRLFRLNKLKRQDLMAKFSPLWFKNIDMARQMHKWKVAVRLLEFAAGWFNPEVDKIFLDVMTTGELLRSYKYAQNFLNALAQCQYPTDAILEQLMTLTNGDNWPQRIARSLMVHSFYDLAMLVARDTISNDTQRTVIAFIADKLDIFKDHCNADADLRHAVLDAVQHTVVPKMLRDAEEPTRHLVRTLVKMMGMCHSTQSTMVIEALLALRHVFDDDQVQSGLFAVIRKANCQMKVDIVQQLATLADSGLTQTDAGSIVARRSWPKYGFTKIDAYLWRALNGSSSDDLNGTASSAENDFWCNLNVVYEYFQKKSDVSMRQRSYFYDASIDIAPERPKTAHKIVRRQLDALGGLFGGGGGGSGGGLSPKFVPELNCRDWDSRAGSYFTEVQDAGLFDKDSLLFGENKKHCLFNATVSFGSLGAAGFKAGFFSGMSNNSDGKLFGRTWLGLSLILSQEIASVEFKRELLNGNFNGHVKLAVLTTTYVNEVQYTCNVTKSNWTFSAEATTPAFRIVFSGFAFIMNADIGVGINLTFWPSHCGGDGSMGVRFQPYAYVDADAYAELENDYFGVGTLATIGINYFVDLLTVMPTGCFYFYHGNDQMIFKFDFYLKLPTFAFINFDPVPVVMKQAYALLTWQFVFKKSSRYVIYGYCFPDLSAKPDTPKWAIGDEGPDEFQ